MMLQTNWAISKLSKRFLQHSRGESINEHLLMLKDVFCVNYVNDSKYLPNLHAYI